MYISELSLLGFRCFGGNNFDADSGCYEKPITISLEPEITALIGRNGSGKSACLMALQRLFGETREERNIRPDDFFVKPGETLECLAKRQLYVEANILFPELVEGQAASEATVPACFNHLTVDEAGGTPRVRVRLERTWASSATLEGSIEENIYLDNVSRRCPLWRR